MTNRTATLNLKKMVTQHSRDLFGMKNLVTTMIPHLDSIMMELLVSMSLLHQNFVKTTTNFVGNVTVTDLFHLCFNM